MARDGLSASRGRNLRKHRGGQRRRLVVLLRDASRQAPSPQVQAVQGSRSQDRVLPRNLGVAVEVDAPAGRSTALPVLTDEPEQAGEPFFWSTQRKLGSGSICQIGSQALSPLLQASGRPAFGTDKPRVFRRLGKGGRLRPSR